MKQLDKLTMKKYVFLLLAVLMTACATPMYYQVYSVVPEDAQLSSNGSPVYKTDNGLEFTYNFWGESGNLRFIVYNSNNYDIIIDLTRSSFIRNNIAEDYYTGKEIEQRYATGVYNTAKFGVSTNVGGQMGASTLDNYFGKTYDVALAISSSRTKSKEFGTTIKREWQTAVVYKEPETIRIPAKSAKALCSFNINNCRIISPLLKAGDTYNPIKFNKELSPLVMNNRICSYTEGSTPVFHDMTFYIDKVGNVKDISTLDSPTLFFVSYSSLLEGSQDNQISLNQINNSNTNTANTDNTTNTSKEYTQNNKQIKVGSYITYEGLEVEVIYADDSDVILTPQCGTRKGSWDTANSYCTSLGEKWRLPSSSECKKLKSHYHTGTYWTNDQVSEEKAFKYDFSYNSESKSNKKDINIILPIMTVSIEDIKLNHE